MRRSSRAGPSLKKIYCSVSEQNPGLLFQFIIAITSRARLRAPFGGRVELYAQVLFQYLKVRKPARSERQTQTAAQP